MICAIIGCSNRSGRDKVRYFTLPAHVKHQGEQMDEITARRRRAWLKAISRDDLTEETLKNIVVCEKHFVKGWLQFVLHFSRVRHSHIIYDIASLICIDMTFYFVFCYTVLHI